jgi:hypothetical protein
VTDKSVEELKAIDAILDKAQLKDKPVQLASWMGDGASKRPYSVR